MKSVVSHILEISSVPHIVVASKDFDVWYHAGTLDGDTSKPLFLAHDEDDARWYLDNNGGAVHAFRLSGKSLDLRSPTTMLKFLATVKELGVEFSGFTSDEGFDCPEIAKHSPFDGTNVNDLFYIPRVLQYFARTYSYVVVLDNLENSEIIAAISLRADGRRLVENG